MNIDYLTHKTKDYEILRDSDGEIYFRSKQPYSSKHPILITLNDSVKDNAGDEKIYIKLANATTEKLACSFCNEYGTLFPINSSLMDEFQELEHSLNLSSFKNDVPLSYDYIPYRHFKFYQLTMKYLISIYVIIKQKEISSQDFENLFFNYINLLLNPYFSKFFLIEFSEPFDEIQMSTSLSNYPLINYIFHLHTYSKDKGIINYFCADISDLINNINLFPNEDLRDFFKRALLSLFDKTFESSLEHDKNFSNNIICLAKYIFSQTLEFFIKDTTPVVTFNYFNNISSWKFTSLRNAIFFYFYIDISSEYSYKTCENEYCKKLFRYPSEQIKRKYCSHRCAHNVTNRKYKNKNK